MNEPRLLFDTQMYCHIASYCQPGLYTVEPLNKDTGLRDQPFCHLYYIIERLSSFRGDCYRVCIQEYFRLVLCWEVCPLSECPLSEVSLYFTNLLSLSSHAREEQSSQITATDSICAILFSGFKIIWSVPMNF